MKTDGGGVVWVGLEFGRRGARDMGEQDQELPTGRHGRLSAQESAGKMTGWHPLGGVRGWAAREKGFGAEDFFVSLQRADA